MMISYAKKEGYSVFMDYNKIESQGDNYSCGYHAIFFNYLFSQSNKPFEYLTIKTMTEDDKSLDKFMVEFHDKIYVSDWYFFEYWNAIDEYIDAVILILNWILQRCKL